MAFWTIHLSVAKKVNPNAKIDFFIGNIAPDSISNKEQKDINHLRNASDMELALKEFALKMNTKNEYLKGFLLHLFVDWKWNTLFLDDFIKKEGDGWYQKYQNEGWLIESYGFHNIDWIYDLWEQMDLCDTFDYVETEFITKEAIKALIRHHHKWKIENKTEPPTAFSLEFIEKFADDTAHNFNKWYSDLKS